MQCSIIISYGYKLLLCWKVKKKIGEKLNRHKVIWRGETQKMFCSVVSWRTCCGCHTPGNAIRCSWLDHVNADKSFFPADEMEAKTPSPCQPPPHHLSAHSPGVCVRGWMLPFSVVSRKQGELMVLTQEAHRELKDRAGSMSSRDTARTTVFLWQNAALKQEPSVWERSFSMLRIFPPSRFQVWFKLLTESSTPNPAGTKSGFYTKDRETCFGHASWLSGNQAEKS